MYRQAYIEQRINHFAELVRTASSFEAKQRVIVKMLEWKRKRTIETVRRSYALHLWRKENTNDYVEKPAVNLL